MALVRTSVNQVANEASQQVIAAENPDVTQRYRYVATLDSRTSPICRALDGQVFEYGKGPEATAAFQLPLNALVINIPPPALEKELHRAEWCRRSNLRSVVAQPKQGSKG